MRNGVAGPAVMTRRVAVALAACLAATVPIAAAHEIGTTTVTIELHEASAAGARTYTATIVTDMQALVEKLDASHGEPDRALATGDVAERLNAQAPAFLERVTLAFNGGAVQPAIAFTVRSAGRALVRPPPLTTELMAIDSGLTPLVATIRLTGVVPAGATSLTWAYGWTFASYAVSVVQPAHAPPDTQWVEGGSTSAPFEIGMPAATTDDAWSGRVSIARQYFWLGLTHIVPKGLDHVLFVVGLFLLGRGWRSVLWQISAFTLAHSITLALTLYGMMGAPPAIVEPLIAISIAYIAVENLVRAELKPWRVVLVFAFGLLHGMGFAGVLTELGLPRGAFVTALVTFNAGVEAGQLIVIATAFALVGWYRAHASYRRHVVVPASVAIAVTAVYWTMERL